MRLLLILLSSLALAPLASAQYLIDPYRYAASVITNNAVFDGTNDFIRRPSVFSATANGKAFTMAFWARIDGEAGLFHRLFFLSTATTPRLWLTRATSPDHTLSLQARNSANTTILNADTSRLLTTTNGWTHLYFAIDLANVSNRHIYFNGIEDTNVTWTTYSNDTIEMAPASANETIGADASDLGKLNGALAEFWFNDAYFNDPTKFISGGQPVPLGPNGALPLGSVPVLYLSKAGSGDAWATDSSGNVNTLTVTGSLGTTTPPP